VIRLRGFGYFTKILLPAAAPFIFTGLRIGIGLSWLAIVAAEMLVGGVGIGFSQHAGMVIVCDGTPEAAARIGRVLWNDPASGVMRHADAGYDIAIDCARQNNLDLPGLA